MQHAIVLVTGTSGTGKTTVLRELDKREIATIGIDEEPHLAYWVNKDTRKPVEGKVVFDKLFLDQHEWVCDIPLLKELLKQRDRPVVICGSCDNIRECMELAEVTLLLHCQPSVFLQRIAERTDNEYGKTEAAQQALLSYYEDYYQECERVGDIMIDVDRPVAEVVKEVLEYIA